VLALNSTLPLLSFEVTPSAGALTVRSAAQPGLAAAPGAATPRLRIKRQKDGAVELVLPEVRRQKDGAVELVLRQVPPCPCLLEQD
jgi:hypothetical protein